jgi:hypothetical protein
VLGLVVPALPVNVVVTPVADGPLVTAPDEDVVAVDNPIIGVGAVTPAAVVPLELAAVVIPTVPAVALM